MTALKSEKNTYNPINTTDYTDEVKKKLDKRYADYLSGSLKMIDAKESRKRVNELLAASDKPHFSL